MTGSELRRQTDS
jgi:hypothetical protein